MKKIRDYKLQCFLCATTEYHVYHTGRLSLKAWLDWLTVWGAENLQPSNAAIAHTYGHKNYTHRNVGKCTAGTRCPDVFGVRIPNNGRVLAAAISHQVVHVALPGHFCEIISKMRMLRKVVLQTSLRWRTTARKLFYHWFDGPPANKSPPAQQRPGFLLVGNEEKLLLSDRRMGVVLTKSLRLGRYSPWLIIA